MNYGSYKSMLPKEYRLKQMKDFEILFKEGRFVAGRIVNAKIWKIEPEKYPKRGYQDTDLKVGFVASVEHEKRAVARNRVKRQMRESVRLLVKDNKIKKVISNFLGKIEQIFLSFYGINPSIHCH